MGRYAVIGTGVIDKALQRAGWVRDRPRNNLGRYRVVYTKGERRLALVDGYGDTVAVFEWDDRMGWTRAHTGTHDDVLRWINREAR